MLRERDYPGSKRSFHAARRFSISGMTISMPVRMKRWLQLSRRKEFHARMPNRRVARGDAGECHREAVRACVGIGEDAANGFETAGEEEGWQHAGLLASGAAERGHLRRLALEHAEARDPAGWFVEPDEDAAALARLLFA